MRGSRPYGRLMGGLSYLFNLVDDESTNIIHRPCKRQCPTEDSQNYNTKERERGEEKGEISIANKGKVSVWVGYSKI